MSSRRTLPRREHMAASSPVEGGCKPGEREDIVYKSNSNEREAQFNRTCIDIWRKGDLDTFM